MEEEPDQQKTSGTYYVHSKDGDYTVTKDEQETIQFIIESNLEQYMNDIIKDYENEQNVVPEQKPTSDIDMDEEISEEEEREEEREEEEEIPERREENRITPIKIENNIDNDFIFSLSKFLITKFESQDVNIRQIKALNRLILSVVFVKYKNLIDYNGTVDIKDKIVEEFSEYETIASITNNIQMFYELFNKKIKEAYNRQKNTFWRGFSNSLEYVLRDEHDLTKNEKRRLIKNAIASAIRTNGQILYQLNNFAVRFIQSLELAFIYGIHLFDIRPLINIENRQIHQIFPGKCSYLFPEYTETTIIHKDEFSSDPKHQGLVGLNNLLEKLIDDNFLNENSEDYMLIEEVNVSKQTLMDKLADAVIFKMGSMKGLTSFNRLKSRIQTMEGRVSYYSKEKDVLLEGYYNIINDISKVVDKSTMRQFIKPSEEEKTLKVGDKTVPVRFFHSVVFQERDTNYNQHLINIIRYFIEIFRIHYSKKKV